jgi:peptidyl-prolyl cis-trans isomerase D
MAKEPQTESRRKPGKGTTIAVWLLMAMLVVGLGGFGVSNFGGNVTRIGAVGDRDIPVNDYARALQQEISAMSAQFGQQLTFTQAQAFGIDRQVLQSMITRTALDNEADRIGISAGDQTVAAEITGMQAFQGTAGTFDRETYRFALDRNNLTEAEFERTLRADVARSVLQGAIVGGFATPAALTDTLYAWAGERRSFSLLRLTEADLPAPLPAPTDADLTAFHTDHIDQFTKPEAERITYVALLPDDMAADMPVDDASLQALYDARIDEFVVPERRLVERLVFPSQADADAAKARLDAGEPFETLVTDRGLTLEDIDLGDVARDDLGAAADAVFALTEPGIVGPLASDLGPALFRMNGVLAAQETTFDQAREALAGEMQADAARRAIGDRVEEIDDLLAGGATLEEVATEAGMDLQQIDYVPGAEDNAEIAGYPKFRAAADALAAGDFPEAVLLDDGGLVALRLDETVPPAPIPFDQVRDEVTAAWRADALAKALSAHATTVKAAVDGGASLGAYGIVSVTRDLPREGFVEGTPPEMMKTLFEIGAGEVSVIEGPEFVGVLRVDSIQPAATEGEDATALREAIAIQAEQSIAQDAFALFTNALTAEAGITLDQTAINAVHAQFN